MRRFFSGLLVAAMCVTAPAAGAGGDSPRGPFLLVRLPSLGTVGWRCDGFGGFGLSYRLSPRTTSTKVGWRVGREVITGIVRPGDRIVFPTSMNRIQKLALVQAAGSGTLRAWVVVDFVPDRFNAYCTPYKPPAFRVRISPRA